MTAFEGLTRDEPWFDTLQGNILKPHGRNHHALVFLSFEGADPRATREWIGALPVTSQREQLAHAAAFRASAPTPTFFGFLLSASGYAALGFTDAGIPADPSFRAGMKSATPRLRDPSPEHWDDIYRRRVDAVLVLADDDDARLRAEVERADAQLRASRAAEVLGVERGRTVRDEQGLSREPFGFRDGLSNPVFFADDVREVASAGGLDRFDPRAPKELVLTRDPNDPDGFGSYMVLRKLEQDVRGFRRAEAELAARLGFTNGDRERAGAMVMGRFRDGTPLARAAAPAGADRGGAAHLNNWDYAGDPAGARCPFHAHARKLNDRGESLRTGSGFGDERFRRISRRGFTYAEHGADAVLDGLVDPPDGAELPDAGVGTMFLAFGATIAEQFEHLQTRFSNNPDYFSAHSGADALIGQRGEHDEAARWPREWGNGSTAERLPFGSFVTLRGGEYLYAPSLAFLRALPAAPSPVPDEAAGPRPSTERTRRLRAALVERAFQNRADEWFTPGMLPSILETDPSLADRPVIVRQALACRAMLHAMADPANSRRTRTFEIRPGELIVGTIPMGSVGLGKTFPGYLTEDEARAASLSNRDEGSVFAHTVPNFRRVLEQGLDGVIAYCRSRLEGEAGPEQRAFFEAVIESCDAVNEFAGRFADLAESGAGTERDPVRRAELVRIAEVSRRVPARPARTFHEALQCVWLIHLAQTAFCAFNSLGRLDQVLGPYLDRDLAEGRLTEDEAVELLECFLIKGAERINLNPATLRDQDFLTFGTGIGTQPIYLDQIASCNNFIQNIVLGGVLADGSDASNPATFLFLRALGGVGLSTPTVNVRVHSGTPPALLEAIDTAFRRARNGHPILFNDDSVVPGLADGGLPLAEARDYALAGCWEPMLHGKNSFIFGMVNMLRVLECALNEGMLLSSDPQFLRGQKQSWRSPGPDEYRDFDQLMAEVARHARFFADKIALGTCTFFLLPGAVTPTPFMSMLLDGCLERGMDQSQGGADYNIVSNLAFAVPNTVNALANIRRFVFEEKRWTLGEVAAALRANWGLSPVRSEYEAAPEPEDELRSKYQEMRRAFLEQGPRFGNADPEADGIARELMDSWYDACKSAEALARRAFLAEPGDPHAARLRAMANYPAPGFRESIRPDFELHFTSGSGTFGQYSSMGKGVTASADGRAANDPLAPNCTPLSGTATRGLEAAFRSLGSLGLDRFGCAVVSDIRVDGTDQEPGFFARLVADWVKAGGSMLTVTVLSTDEVAQMLRTSDRVRANPADIALLEPWADRYCRVGGWNSTFVCLPRAQQRDHLLRAQW